MVIGSILILFLVRGFNSKEWTINRLLCHCFYLFYRFNGTLGCIQRHKPDNKMKVQYRYCRKLADVVEVTTSTGYDNSSSDGLTYPYPFDLSEPFPSTDTQEHEQHHTDDITMSRHPHPSISSTPEIIRKKGNKNTIPKKHQ